MVVINAKIVKDFILMLQHNCINKHRRSYQGGMIYDNKRAQVNMTLVIN